MISPGRSSAGAGGGRIRTCIAKGATLRFMRALATIVEAIVGADAL